MYSWRCGACSVWKMTRTRGTIGQRRTSDMAAAARIQQHGPPDHPISPGLPQIRALCPLLPGCYSNKCVTVVLSRVCATIFRSARIGFWFEFPHSRVFPISVLIPAANITNFYFHYYRILQLHSRSVHWKFPHLIIRKTNDSHIITLIHMSRAQL